MFLQHSLAATGCLERLKPSCCQKIPRRCSAVPRTFVREGEQGKRGPPPLTKIGQQEGAWDCEMPADVGQRLTVPSEIVNCQWHHLLRRTDSALRGCCWWSEWEEEEMASKAEQQGWRAPVGPMEVGCRGFIAKSTIRLLKELGIHRQAHQRNIRDCRMLQPMAMYHKERP